MQLSKITRVKKMLLNKTYSYQKTLVLLTRIQKMSYFQIATPGHTIYYKKQIIYKKTIGNYLISFYSFKIWCLRNVQSFIDVQVP